MEGRNAYIRDENPMPVILAKSRARPKQRTGGKMKLKKTVKRRSAAAAALATPTYRKRVVKSAKAYSRKGKARTQGEEGDEA
jgi:stalled ribosome alternative rescue factor ArfA